MEKITRDWLSLPDDVLGFIARLLYLQSPDDDFRRFSAVCRSFRSSSRSVTVPSKTLTPNPVYSEALRDYSLNKSCVYAIQPLHKISSKPETAPTWLVRVEESNTGKPQIMHPHGWFLFYPKNQSAKIPKYLNLLDYQVKKITTFYQFVSYGDERFKNVPIFIFKRVVASEPLDSDRFAIMAIHYFSGNLFVWRNGEENWIEMNGMENLSETGQSPFFTDIVYHNGNFYALVDFGHYVYQTVIVDPKSLNITKIADCPQIHSANIHLVKSLVDLFLIFRAGNGYNVSKLDEKNYKWVPVNVVDELEDRVFVIASFFSFSHSAREFSEHKLGNCVYFVGLCYFNPSCSVFDLKANTWRPLLNLPSHSKIFWPPPVWVKQRSRSAPHRLFRSLLCCR